MRQFVVVVDAEKKGRGDKERHSLKIFLEIAQKSGNFGAISFPFNVDFLSLLIMRGLWIGEVGRGGKGSRNVLCFKGRQF